MSKKLFDFRSKYLAQCAHAREGNRSGAAVARYTAKRTEEQKQHTKQKKTAQQRAAYAGQLVEEREYRRLQKANSRSALEPSNLMRSGQLQRLKIMLGKPEQPPSSFLSNKRQQPCAQLDAESIHTAMGSFIHNTLIICRACKEHAYAMCVNLTPRKARRLNLLILFA